MNIITNSREAGLFAVGNAVAIPHTIIGIGKAGYDLYTEKETEEKLLAGLDIATGVSGIGRAFSISVFVISIFSSITSSLVPICSIVSLAASGLSLAYTITLGIRWYKTDRVIKQFEYNMENETPLDALNIFLKCTDPELSRHFNTNGKELREKINLVKESSPETLSKHLISRMHEKIKTDQMGIALGIASIGSALMFFFLLSTPLAPVVIITALLLTALQIYNVGSDYISKRELEDNLDNLVRSPSS